jgi:hypothetical protein
MEMTWHAQTRAQQRAISAEILDLLLAFGTEMRHRGADVLCVDRASRRRLQSGVDASTLRRLGRRRLNVYAVLGDGGRVITLAHCTRRLKRP